MISMNFGVQRGVSRRLLNVYIKFIASTLSRLTEVGQQNMVFSISFTGNPYFVDLPESNDFK